MAKVSPSPPTTNQTAALIKARALEEGFDLTGFALPHMIGDAGEHLHEFLALGRQGTMTWMEDKADRRADPTILWPDVRSVIMLAVNYGPDHNPLDDLAHTDRGGISVYARNRDYHDVIKKRLRRLGRWIGETFDTELKIFVDTAPVMEKPLARMAGLGWQGKHSNLVSRRYGSWLFLGAIFTRLELAPDIAEGNHCGDCHACLDICPTNAFPAPYQLDARRCISYLTIEHKGHIAAEFRPLMGNRIYGCDDCLAVCPWNKFASATTEMAFVARPELTAPLLVDLAQLDDPSFRSLFSKSPVKRIGRDRFVRNILIALGNSTDDNRDTAFDCAESLLRDPSPLVRAMAVWACSRLAPAPSFAALRDQHFTGEDDADVRQEWDL